MKKTKLLLTNDDGYRAVGFTSLLEQLKNDYLVTAVAPENGMSWIGKAITTHKVEIKKNKVNNNEVFSVKGTPADCAQIGIYNLSEDKPDWLVSGINIGENLGYGWIFSSGTVGAAMEAALQGVKAIAISQRFPLKERKKIDFYDQDNLGLFQEASQIAKKVIDKIVKENIQEVDFFIVNMPYKVKVDAALEITRPYKGSYGQLFYQKNGTAEFKEEVPKYINLEPGIDHKAVAEERVAITPVKIELTPERIFKLVSSKLKLGHP